MKIITAAKARARHLDRYFTGKPCKHGHVAERHTRSGTCVVCTQIWGAAKNAEALASRLKIAAAREEAERLKPESVKAAERSARSAERSIMHRKAYWEKVRGIKVGSAEHNKIVQYKQFVARVRSLVSGAFYRSGARKCERTEAILGCSLQEFFAHIERQFLPGMTWENRHLWHIDHIIPISTAKTEADVIALNHVSNLRPIWGPDNIAKSDKILFLI